MKRRHVFLAQTATIVALSLFSIGCGDDDGEKSIVLNNQANNGTQNNGLNNGANNGSAMLTGVEVEAGQAYAATTSVKFSVYGIGFDIPEPFEGNVSGDFFFLTRNDLTAFVMIGPLRGTLADAQTTLAGPIDLGDGFTSTPTSEPVTDGNVVSVQTAVSNGQTMFAGAVRTIIGPHGVNLFLFSIGPPNEIDQVETAADAVQARLVFVEPDVPEPGTSDGEWKAVLDGKKVTRFFTATDYFEEESYFLCADGTYSRTFSSSAANLSETGQWSVEGSLNQGRLTVFSNEGNTRELFPMVFSSEVKFTVGSTDWFMEDGGC